MADRAICCYCGVAEGASESDGCVGHDVGGGKIGPHVFDIKITDLEVTALAIVADLTPKEQEALGLLQRTPAHWARVVHYPAPPGEGHRDGWGVECQTCDYGAAPFPSFEVADHFAREHEKADCG